MAFNALKQCRSSLQRPLLARTLASSSTASRFASSAATSGVHQQPGKGGWFSGLAALYRLVWMVIGLLGGMVGIACCIGIHTAKLQRLHSLSVQVTKSRRECVPEVEILDVVVRSADKFENKSFLRNVVHIFRTTSMHIMIPHAPIHLLALEKWKA